MYHSPLAGKTIVLGVSGGIAAYKSVELVRILTTAGALVRVVMTQSAQQFVGPATFQALTEQPVYTDMWQQDEDNSIRHVAWAHEADALIIAPATANIIGKMAHGIADDPLSTLVLAAVCPKLVCPAMNTKMFENSLVQENLARLSSHGFSVMAPGAGFLACGDTGPGRLPDPDKIADRLMKLLTRQDLDGKCVLVSAGPTREPIDPVRYISNPSTGKMGYAIARAAEHRGAKVILVTGPVSISPPENVETHKVMTALEMAEVVLAQAERADIVIKTAAVGDYRCEREAEQKIKKTGDCMTLDLVPNPDILMELGKRKGKKVLIGFAAETEKLTDHAQEKLRKKNLDMIAANLIGPSDSGFGADTNKITCFSCGGATDALGLMSKEAAAHAILDKAAGFLPECGVS
ncbi:phosphopantothenoylcysteine decarboxylase/phosphopantothenate/cysteine ligase [Desulfatibacillum aliphaticivorans]|uniref:Coenzyme A biosynthesis bifunctional protein CoaBC n=1 Tax=Desulfatibacillum aliphaticivorans TaxID=218208 RepID=B8FNB8_DESAL|nr:bifunctional phosphopantothenoylcysteine decarboxylase/phosphopantothenate--cysteine ligase CoaBC [Desulfatibacillum aliphaticivorans]ACL06087.1 phosphopantothenoylcysteine decarboxylase/phosphopantothenate/cysteine ligase [Desulfatibacillum aliphaticivorans]